MVAETVMIILQVVHAYITRSTNKELNEIMNTIDLNG